MDFTGLYTRYNNNRPLTEEENQYQLHQARKVGVEPHYELSVIKMNSTFMDSVDRHYAQRGIPTLFCIPLAGIALGLPIALILLAWSAVTEGREDATDLIWVAALTSLLFSSLVVLAVWIARKEIFRLTHYPIRFDRKNRMVHVFKPTGGMLSVHWDQIFFTLGRCTGGMFNTIRDIRGLILDQDGVTVRDQFALSLWSPELDHLRGHWEFVRRYMEEGPANVGRQVEFCLPIDGRRETFRASTERVFAVYSHYPLVYWPMWPFNFLHSVVRWIVMRTCAIPKWPEEIEKSTPVDANDPYAKDSRINPPELR